MSHGGSDSGVSAEPNMTPLLDLVLQLLMFFIINVNFVSEQVNVVRNADGQIADGNPNEVQKVVDLWTFRRDTKSGDPNWLLIKTESEG